METINNEGVLELRIQRLLQELDGVVQPQQRPSAWPIDGLVALLVAAVAYPPTIHMNYRAKWTRDAESFWTHRNDISVTTMSSMLHVLDKYDAEKISVAYLHTDGVVGRAFGRYQSEADHGYLTLAGCPMILRCTRETCIVSTGVEKCTATLPSLLASTGMRRGPTRA